MLSWNQAYGLVAEVLRSGQSHTRSALAGDVYVPHPAEVATWDTFEGWFNTQTKKGVPYKKIPRPWTGRRPNYEQIEKHDPEREARRAKIREMTGRPARG